MLARTGGGLIKGRNSVHLQACAARKFPNISCMIGCNLNRCTYIRLPTCRSRLCLVACRGICRGDVATGGPLEAGSLKNALERLYCSVILTAGFRSVFVSLLRNTPVSALVSGLNQIPHKLAATFWDVCCLKCPN